MIVDRNLQNAQPGSRRAHLHFDIPSIGQLAHGRDQAEHVLRDLEHCLGERITHEMRTLRRRVEGRAAARRVEIGNGVARLHRVDNDTVVEEFECDNAHDPRECGVGAG